MTNQELLDILGNIKGEYILQAQALRSGEQKKAIRKISWKRAILIAAVLSLLLMLVGCTIIYVLHLQDVKIGQETVTREEWYGPNGEYEPAETWVNSYLSIQGFNNSANQKALQEWLDFQKNYDTDYVLAKQNNHNESGVPENYYMAYDAYTFEMVEKLEEILGKYHLKAFSVPVHFDRWEVPLFYKALGLDSLLTDDDSIDHMVGYFFSDGSFHVEFEMKSEAQSYLVDLSFYHSDYFMPYPFLVKNIEAWDQWSYTTGDGQNVLLCKSEDYGLIICNRGDSVLTCSIKRWDHWEEIRNITFTKEILEQFAESVDYSINPQPVDIQQAEQMRADYPRPKQEKNFLIGFQIDPSGTWHPPEGYTDSFEQYVDYIIANDPKAADRCFAFLDFDGDGEMELLLGKQDGTLTEVVDMVDGMVSIYWATWITDENVIVKYYPRTESFPENYEVFTLDHTTHFSLEKTDAGWDETTYVKNGEWTTKTITDAEATMLLNHYPSILLNMKPLSEWAPGNN